MGGLTDLLWAVLVEMVFCGVGVGDLGVGVGWDGRGFIEWEGLGLRNGLWV